MAGGQGLRMQSELPKQFMPVGGIPVLMHSIHKFTNTFPDISVIVVLPETHVDLWHSLCAKHQFDIPHRIALGGSSRFQSVKNGLNIIEETQAVVGIHDAARMFVTSEIIRNCYETAETKGSAIPVTELTESIRKIENTNSKIVPRNEYRLVQTPQCFHLDKLRKAYETEEKPIFTDDASVFEHAGFAVNLVTGDPVNIKITNPMDLIIAEALINNKTARL